MHWVRVTKFDPRAAALADRHYTRQTVGSPQFMPSGRCGMTQLPEPRLILGDCVEAMRELDACSIDAICTDPPYGLEFMGKEWDRLAPSDRARMNGERRYDAASPAGAYERAGVKYVVEGRAMQGWHEEWAAEALRVLKPGGFLLAFGGTRTYHRLAAGIEDAGFEIRDCIAWVYGSGFPKSMDVSKAIDKAAGAERTERVAPKVGHEEFVGRDNMRALREGTMAQDGGFARPWMNDPDAVERAHWSYAPATPEAARWQGWGTALKPAFEPVVVARKPLIGTVAANVLEHGVGGLNIDACRVAFQGAADEAESKDKNQHAERDAGPRENEVFGTDGRDRSDYDASGRWPANVLLGHSPDCVPVGEREVASDGHFPSARPGGVEVRTVGHAGQDGLDEYTRGEMVEVWECVADCPVRILDEQTGELRSQRPTGPHDRTREIFGNAAGGPRETHFGDAGGASRFFYCAKTSRAERNAGLDGFEPQFAPTMGNGIGGKEHDPETATPKRNSHPTVKPIDLMRWLLRLVVPPGGTILDPFLGSGTTGCAAALERLGFVGIEREPAYLAIAEARIRFWGEHGEDGLRIVRERDAGERVRRTVEESGQLDLLGGLA